MVITFPKVTKDINYKPLSKIKVKNSCIDDDISNDLLKYIICLCHLYNSSFKLGEVPDSMKMANVYWCLNQAMHNIFFKLQTNILIIE